MAKFSSLILFLCTFCIGANAGTTRTSAADTLSLKLTESTPSGGLSVCRGDVLVMDIPSVGYGGRITGRPAFVRHLKEDYTMLAGKRRHCTNSGSEYAVAMSDGVRLVVRLYADGLAFRYELDGLQGEPLPRERTAYRFADGTRRWMQRWADSYEGFFPLTTSAKDGGRWGYPVLLEPADGLFTLVTEAGIERGHSASCLYNDAQSSELFRVVPDATDAKPTGRWCSPWRVVIVGTLADVVQSTLVTDVSAPCRVSDTGWIKPGTVSWIYWAYNHGSKDYDIIKKYVDMARTLSLPYVLIDAEWDEMDRDKNGEKKSIEDAVAYALSQGVKPMIWYNSSVGWVNGAPGPKFRLNKAEDREREFAWCEKTGVAGVKIDFFSGDSQMNMEYCLDLMECAARHHLLINFHGATIPRGWQRTYPNLLTTEGVYGAEWYNNGPTFTNRAARHNATLPFTRNVVGPMDYTPCTFSDSQHPHITSNAHELALTVLFESGLQHLADRPESYLAQPAEVQRFLGSLPTAWDDTRLLTGYPGESVVMARRSGNSWYIAGINGTDEKKDMRLELGSLLDSTCRVNIFLDGESQPWDIRSATAAALPSTISCKPRGGFVIVAQGE